MEFDGVELILRIEDEFFINISDDEASAAHTVGDLCDVVLDKLRTPSSRASNEALYRVRRALANTIGLPRRSVQSSTWLEPLLPQPTRIERWKEIASRVGIELPALRHTGKWRDGFILFSLVAATVLVLVLWWAFESLGWLPGVLRWFFLAPATAAWLILASRINNALLLGTPRLAIEIPFKTAGELASAVLALHYQAFEASDAEPPSKESTWLRIVEILCDELQISPEYVRRHQRIVEDLGVS